MCIRDRVADVKQNRLFYSWIDRGAPPINRMATQVSVPVTEINDKTKVELRRQMLKEAA